MSDDFPASVLKRQSAFSLMEMSVVLIVLSVVLGGVLPYITEGLKQADGSDTIDRMEAIERALLVFRAANDRIPCPADMTASVNSAGFGTEAATPGTCTGANFSSAGVVGGMVPTKSLGLPDEYAFDGWGQRIAYHVHTAFTADATSGDGSIIVNDSAGTPRTSLAAYVLVSYGMNGIGGYTRGGWRATVNGAGDELENCARGAGVCSAAYNTTFVQKVEQSGFDDIVRYGLRAQLDLLVGAGGGGGGSGFHVTHSVDITNSAPAEIALNTEVLDSESVYDTSTGRFTPTEAGEYYVYATAGSHNCQTNENAEISLRKNGTIISRAMEEGGSADTNGSLSVAAIVDMNGSSDYVSLYAGDDGCDGVRFANNMGASEASNLAAAAPFPAVVAWQVI